MPGTKTSGNRTGNGGSKFTDEERERVKAKVAELDRRGYNTYRIAEMLPGLIGVTIAQGTVAMYLRQIREAYRTVQLQSQAELVVEKLEQYRELRAIAWDAYEKSLGDEERKQEEFVPPPQPKPGDRRKGFTPDPPPHLRGSAAEILRRLKLIVTRTGRLPANEYLTTVLKTLEAERTLLGLDQAQKLNVAQTTVSVNWGGVLAGSVPMPRPAIEAEIDELSKLLPAAKVQERA